jgi:glycosyltransferase involved in cell wall biosynthesis
MSKISVLISVYKSEKSNYLEEALKSVWEDQIFKPFEIVLIEDGVLNDELYSVITSYKEKLKEKLKIIKNKQNLGLTKSLNLGLLQCEGDYIARMDSDDISKKDRFLLQVNFLDENPDIDILGGAIKEFHENSDLTKIRNYPTSFEKVKKTIFKRCPLAHPSVMLRRKIFDSGFFYNEKYRTTQDLEFWYRLIENGFKITNLDKVVLLFRVNDDLFKRRSKEKAINEFKIYFFGIIKIYGISYYLIYPFLRLATRFLPKSLIKIIYKSKLRNLIN